MPTFAELSGAPLPSNQPVDGTSIVPLIKGKTIPDRAIFWHYPLYLSGVKEGKVIPVHGTKKLYWRAVPSSMIMKGDWKLIHFFEDNSYQLYNPAKDISEKRDLSAENPGITKTLIAELTAWQKETKAVIPVTLNDTFSPGSKPSNNNDKKKNRKKHKSN